MQLWKDLDEAKHFGGENWIVGGDFNMVLKREERSGNILSSTIADGFSDAIDGLGLMDMPLTGGRWTWSNQRASPYWSRIDRFLIYTRFIPLLNEVIQNLLQRPISAHFPLCLVDDGIQWGPIPFRLDNI